MATVLLVDSDRHSHTSLDRALASAGHAVVTEPDATSAWTQLREGGVDVVVLDPKLSGVENLVQRIHSLPEPPPIILLSEHVDAPQLSAKLGVARLLLKPCQGEELVQAVNDTVNLSGVPKAVDDVPTSPVEQTGPFGRSHD